MLIATIAFLVVGIFLLVAGGLWSVVLAFQKHVLWGFAVLFLPPAGIVFTVIAWAQTKRPFAMCLAGAACCAFGIVLIPTESSGSSLRNANMRAAVTEGPAEPVVQHTFASFTKTDVEVRLAALKARENELLSRKSRLDPKDTEATRALADEINRYNSELQPLLARKRLLEGAEFTSASAR